MGLIKNKISNYGIPIEYWNISSVEFDKLEGVCIATINGYMNKEHRESENAQPLEVQRIVICINEYEDVIGIEPLSKENNNPYKIIYDYIKENREFFMDAEDI